NLFVYKPIKLRSNSGEEDLASMTATAQTLPGRLDHKVVIDTHVMLIDALAIQKFHGADIYIPFSVIEEIDRFKRDLGENGRNARHFSRFVDVLREKGSLAQGVELENCKSFVFVISDFHFSGLPPEMNLGIP